MRSADYSKKERLKIRVFSVSISPRNPHRVSERNLPLSRGKRMPRTSILDKTRGSPRGCRVAKKLPRMRLRWSHTSTMKGARRIVRGSNGRQIKALVRWFPQGLSSDAIARERGMERKRVLRALRKVRKPCCGRSADLAPRA